MDFLPWRNLDQDIPAGHTVIKNTGDVSLDVGMFYGVGGRPYFATGVIPPMSEQIIDLFGYTVVIGPEPKLARTTYDNIQQLQSNSMNVVTVGTRANKQDLQRNVTLPNDGPGILTAHTIPLPNDVTVITAKAVPGSNPSIGFYADEIESLVPGAASAPKPFYKTTWFGVLCIVIVIVAIALTIVVVGWKKERMTAATALAVSAEPATSADGV